MTIADMLKLHPSPVQIDQQMLSHALETLAACAGTCTICADASLAEQDVAELRRVIRLDLDCADVCDITARLLARQTEPDWRVVRRQLEACVASCEACGAECERHASHHEHCRVCAETCYRCVDTCRQLLDALPA